jgi:hypothetical protein
MVEKDVKTYNTSTKNINGILGCQPSGIPEISAVSAPDLDLKQMLALLPLKFHRILDSEVWDLLKLR